MIIFLVLVFVTGIILYAVVEAGSAKKRRRGRHGSSGSHGRTHYPSGPPVDVPARWATIMATSATGASGLKSAINEADKLLDYALREAGASGETMGDRLRSAGARFSNRNDVWRAHKLRNALAHEVGFDLVPSQAKEALSDFEQGLRDLGAIR